MNYSVLLTKVNIGVFPTAQLVDIPTLKFPQDVAFFLHSYLSSQHFFFFKCIIRVSPLNPLLEVSYVDGIFGYSEKKKIPL